MISLSMAPPGTGLVSLLSARSLCFYVIVQSLDFFTIRQEIRQVTKLEIHQITMNDSQISYLFNFR